jgi:hypothetical protein
MDKEQFLSSITEIGSLEDIAEVRAKLTELSDDVSNIFDLNSEVSEKVTKLEEDNEKLRSANMQLFLKVGSQKKPEDITPDPKPEPRSFKNLFNEKGEII